MIILETFSGGPASMDNPVILSVPDVSIGDTFTFKGEHCRIISVARNQTGFWYHRQSTDDKAFMTWNFYKTIPSQLSRKGRIVGIHRNQVKKQKLIRFIEGLY